MTHSARPGRGRDERGRPWREAPIDAVRALRATSLTVLATMERGIYQVLGGDELHWVNFADVETPLCDCADHGARDVLCKHGLAVLLREGNRRARRAVRHAAIAESLAHGVKRAAAADIAYQAVVAEHGLLGLPVPWQVDARGVWNRPARHRVVGEELIVVAFVPERPDVRAAIRVPF